MDFYLYLHCPLGDVRCVTVLLIMSDEAGRGPLAGPVVAAACIVGEGVHIDGINDSKQTTEADRERTYESLVSNPMVKWQVSIVSHAEIDEVNILQGTMNAMRRATEGIFHKYESTKKSSTGRAKKGETLLLQSPSDYIALIDGNRVPLNMPVHSKFVIKGDGTCFSIAAASIIAKVTRDRIMLELATLYPQYNLAQHKGYPTAAHRATVHSFGPSDIHRLTFGPVKAALLHHSGKVHSSADCLQLYNQQQQISSPVRSKSLPVAVAAVPPPESSAAVSKKKKRPYLQKGKECDDGLSSSKKALKRSKTVMGDDWKPNKEGKGKEEIDIKKPNKSMSSSSSSSSGAGIMKAKKTSSSSSVAADSNLPKGAANFTSLSSSKSKSEKVNGHPSSSAGVRRSARIQHQREDK